MKSNIHFWLLALIAMSCSVIDEPNGESPFERKGVNGSVVAASCGEISTKATEVFENSALNFVWEQGDVIGVVPLDGQTNQTNYLVKQATGSVANFDGGSWKVKNGQYAAYFPYISCVANSNDIVKGFSLSGQKQVGNGSEAHLGNYNFMYSNADCTDGGNISFSFVPWVSWTHLQIPASAGSYKRVEFISDEAVFPTEATLDLGSGTWTATNFANSYALDLENVSLTADGQVDVWITFAPISLKGKMCVLRLIDTNDEFVEYNFKGYNMSSNTYYNAASRLSDKVESVAMPAGQVFNAAVKSAAGGDAQNVHKLSFKTGQVVTNTTAGYDITYNSETNEVVVSTNAEELKLPADASHMFDGFTEMTEIDGMDKINTTDVTNMACMFNDCLSLVSLDVSGFETSKVTDMQRMFDSCRSLSVLNLSSFDTELVTTMYAMFNYCQELTDLNISSFRTPSIETFAQMFYGCSAIERLDLSMWDVSNAYGFARMFTNCKKLSWLNIEGWDLNLAKNYGASYHQDIFSGIAASNIGIDIASQKPTPLTLYCDEAALVTIVDWLRECECRLIDWLSPRPTETPVLPLGYQFNSKIKEMAGGYGQVGSISFSAINSVYELKGENILDTYPGIYVYVDDYGGTTKDVYVSTLAPKMEANPNSDSMFHNFDEMRTVSGWENVITSTIESTGYMFQYCEKLTYADLIHFSTENVTDMCYMFDGCNSYNFGKELRYFSTSNVTDMEAMFQNCCSVTELDLSSFNTSNVEYMDYMFAECTNLERIVLGDYFTIEDGCNINHIVSDVGDEIDKTMFICPSAFWNTITTTSGTDYVSSKHFREADYALLPKDFIDHTYSYNSTNPIKRIVFITGSSYNDGTAMAHTDGAPVYREFQSAGYNTEAGRTEYEYRVYTSAKEFRLPADASDFFNLSQASILEEIDGLEYLNTSAVTNMSGMFSNAKIPYLDLHSFDVSHVTNMSEMFYSTDIKVINLDGFKTSSLTDMNNMFYASTKLEKIDMPTFDLTHVSNCSSAFGRCWNLYSVKLGTKFIIGNGCYTSNMFESLGVDVDASVHSGYNTTFYCTQNIFEGYIRDLLPQDNGCRYRYVGSADVGFDGGDNDGGRMTD